jgi:hypothetical protein
MATLWMTLSEGFKATTTSRDLSGQKQFVAFLRGAELETRADKLTVKVRAVGVLRNKSTGQKTQLLESLKPAKTKFLATLDPIFWMKAEVDIDAGRAVVKSRGGVVLQIAEGVRVSRTSIERLNSPPTKPENKGGAEPQYDWEGAAIEMARILYVEQKLSKGRTSQAAMIERLKDWFEQQPEGVPGDTQLKRHARRFLSAHAPVEQEC